jgi:hypothetical protein
VKTGKIDEAGKQFVAHRQFNQMYFKANDMDFAFKWMMGSAVHGGDRGELLCCLAYEGR